MHIEPGIVTGAKLVLSYATATLATGCALKLAAEAVGEQGIASFVLRTIATTVLVFSFFELLPHFRVGVSEGISFWVRRCSCFSAQHLPPSGWLSACCFRG
jgi:hypothetical protein